MPTYLWRTALHVQNYAGTSLADLWSLAVEERFHLALMPAAARPHPTAPGRRPGAGGQP